MKCTPTSDLLNLGSLENILSSHLTSADKLTSLANLSNVSCCSVEYWYANVVCSCFLCGSTVTPTITNVTLIFGRITSDALSIFHLFNNLSGHKFTLSLCQLSKYIFHAYKYIRFIEYFRFTRTLWKESRFTSFFR